MTLLLLGYSENIVFIIQRMFIIAVKLRHNLPEMQCTKTVKYAHYGEKTQKIPLRWAGAKSAARLCGVATKDLTDRDHSLELQYRHWTYREICSEIRNALHSKWADLVPLPLSGFFFTL